MKTKKELEDADVSEPSPLPPRVLVATRNYFVLSFACFNIYIFFFFSKKKKKILIALIMWSDIDERERDKGAVVAEQQSSQIFLQ